AACPTKLGTIGAIALWPHTVGLSFPSGRRSGTSRPTSIRCRTRHSPPPNSAPRRRHDCALPCVHRRHDERAALGHGAELRGGRVTGIVHHADGSSVWGIEVDGGVI